MISNKLQNLTVSITGAAGFIGSNLVRKFINEGIKIDYALDSFKPSYKGRWCNLRQKEFIPEQKINRCNILEISPSKLAKKFGSTEIIIHLAAYPGIREGEKKSHEYLVNNVISSSLILEACKINRNIKAIIFASSSSIYGDQGLFAPCKESDTDTSQIKSNYAMTKLINEVQFSSWQRKLNIPIIGLRFFTVFGEWGRPDMAYSKFTNSILKGESVKIYGNDGGSRNMTHINDVTETIMRLINFLQSSNFSSEFGFQIFNVASTNSISALDLAGSIGSILNKEVNYEFIERPPGDAIATKADLTKISNLVGLPNPRNMQVDIANYTDWHRKHMKYFPK